MHRWPRFTGAALLSSTVVAAVLIFSPSDQGPSGLGALPTRGQATEGVTANYRTYLHQQQFRTKPGRAPSSTSTSTTVASPTTTTTTPPPSPTTTTTPVASTTTTTVAQPATPTTLAPSVVSADPSGEAMPIGNLPGWNEVFSDDFNEAALDPSKWLTYWGVPGGDPAGWFDPSHVTTSGGVLDIATYQDPADGDKWAGGGVSLRPGLSQTYGKYLVRFRFSAGVGVAHTLLLWPADNSWPPEIDFSEDNGSNRQIDTSTLHYGSNNTQQSATVSVDLTQWHTFGVEWSPGKIVYTLDGTDWATMTGAQVPSVPMALAMQTQSWACGGNWEQCPDASTPARVDLDIDWVVAYALAG
jgi:beta-glucanase (GH16 family)